MERFVANQQDKPQPSARSIKTLSGILAALPRGAAVPQGAIDCCTPATLPVPNPLRAPAAAQPTH
jgi:hypothetical protein